MVEVESPQKITSQRKQIQGLWSPMLGSMYSTPTMENSHRNLHFTPAPALREWLFFPAKKTTARDANKQNPPATFMCCLLLNWLVRFIGGKKNFHLGGENWKVKKENKWKRLISDGSHCSVYFCRPILLGHPSTFWSRRDVAWLGHPSNFFWGLTFKRKSVSQANLFKEWNTCF